MIYVTRCIDLRAAPISFISEAKNEYPSVYMSTSLSLNGSAQFCMAKSLTRVLFSSGTTSPFCTANSSIELLVSRFRLCWLMSFSFLVSCPKKK